MADIQLRFHKDMLVLSSSIQAELGRLGINAERDGELTLLLEPEVIEDAYKLETFTGVQCLVAPTANLTPARLLHTGMTKRAPELAQAAIRLMRGFNPQHILVELGPCGLPLDAASKASLNENCDQYKRAAQFFADEEFDAFFLNGFTRVADLKCALIGIRKVTDMPVFASVDLDADGFLLGRGESLEDAVAVMAEYGAQVAGFCTTANASTAASFAKRISAAVHLPILAQFKVENRSLECGSECSPSRNSDLNLGQEQEVSAENDPYFEADAMFDAAEMLREAGVQFLRATGDATSAYTGVLVAATDGLDAILPEGALKSAHDGKLEPVEDAAARLRAKVNAAING